MAMGNTILDYNHTLQCKLDFPKRYNQFKPTYLSRATVYAATVTRPVTVGWAPPVVTVAVTVVIAYLRTKQVQNQSCDYCLGTK